MYLSPFRIIGIHAARHAARMPDRKGILLERKKYLAELELTDGHGLTINGRKLSKQDILRAFDELLNDTLRSYHLAILTDNDLLCFLEDGELEKGKLWNEHALYADAGFRSFVSPYFALAYDRLMSAVIQLAACDLSGLLHETFYENKAQSIYRTLDRNSYLLLPVHREQAFRYAHRFYAEKKAELFALSDRAELYTNSRHRRDEINISDIDNWCSDHAILLLNLFPDEFSEVRHSLACELNSICVSCNWATKLHIAYAAVLKARLIETDTALMEVIKENINIIYSCLPHNSPLITSQPANKEREYRADKKAADIPDTTRNASEFSQRLIALLCLALVLFAAYHLSKYSFVD